MSRTKEGPPPAPPSGVVGGLFPSGSPSRSLETRTGECGGYYKEKDTDRVVPVPLLLDPENAP